MQEDILKDLKDIHWPGPPSWWPPAFGYYTVLAALVVLALALWFFYGLGSLQRRIKREIMSELARINAQFLETSNVSELQSSVSALLKRIAFFVGDDVEKNARLSDLAPALLKTLPDREKTMQLIELVEKDRFHPHPDVDGNVLLTLAREQIKRCRI